MVIVVFRLYCAYRQIPCHFTKEKPNKTMFFKFKLRQISNGDSVVVFMYLVALMDVSSNIRIEPVLSVKKNIVMVP